MTGLLSDVTVLQLGGGLRLAYAGRLLADLGARVVTPDRPSGHLLAEFLDRDKDVVVLPTSPANRARAVTGLADMASLALVDLHTDTAAADLAAIDGLVPQVRVRDHPSARTGSPPMPELLLQARAGWVYRRGPVPTPVRVGGRLAELAVGAFTAVAGLVALLEAETTPAAVVDLCALEALYTTLPLSRFYRGPQTNPLLDAGPPGILRCADGWVGINCLTGQHWADLCALTGLDEYRSRLPEIKASEHELAAFREQVPDWFLAQPAAEIVSTCQAMRIPAAPVGNGSTVPLSEHWLARDSITSLPVGGRDLPCPRPPFRVTEPEPGLPPVERGERPAGLPFAGCRVLDLGSFWAAPYATCLMGALGADVLKIEGPRRPDGFRYFGVSPEEGDLWYESGAAWQATNLNKRGVAIDLTEVDGRELLLRLAESADVVIENFSPRVFEQFGLDHAVLTERNPAISLLRMPAYGLDGPWRDYVGWAATFEEIGGLAEVTGFPDGPPCIPGGQSDPVAGLHAAVALFAALRRARQTGHGSDLEVATSDVMLYLAAEQVLDSAAHGRPTTRTGNDGHVTGDAERGWCATVGEESVPVVPPHHLPDDLAETGMTTRFPVAGAPSGRVFLNWPLHLAGLRVGQASGPPLLGEHTGEVLAELGCGAADIAALRDRGVVGGPDVRRV